MPSCVFRKCKNYTGTVKEKRNISFHALPKDGPIRDKWLDVVRAQRREDDWMPTTFTKICSDHFLESDIYVTKNNIRKLKKTAVPIIEREERNKITTNANVEQLNEKPVCDAPRIVYLKTKIRKLSRDKKKLQLKNYDLVRKNKRLLERCNNFKKIVSQLKRNILE